MNCIETRQCLFAFLDNELESARSVELQEHLNRCPSCAREAEIERVIRKRLEQAVQADVSSMPQLDALVGRVTTFPQLDRRRFFGRGGVPKARWGALAAAIIIIAVGTIWVVRPVARSESSDRTLVVLAAADYAHFLEEGRQLQIVSDDRARVRRWLEEKTGIHIDLPGSITGVCALLGARKCKLAGAPAAFAVYDVRGTAVSVVGVLSQTVPFGESVTKPVAGTPLRAVAVDPFHTVVWHTETVDYAATSTLPLDELARFVTVGFHEID